MSDPARPRRTGHDEHGTGAAPHERTSDGFEAVHLFQSLADIPTFPLRLRRLSHSYTRATDEVLRREVGITLARFTVLATLESFHGIPGAQLAELTWQRPQSLSEMVSALEAEGLVERRPGCGRERLHSLTEAGHALLGPSRRVVRRLYDEVVSGLGVDAIAALEGQLAAIQRNLDDPNREISET